MEQYSQYLMWMKRKHHHILNSWEEQAFAEDTYEWPPRSYACSFCKKEFRSAQALGGHMNVHRRDRARLNDQSQVCPQTQVTATHFPSYKICDSNSSNPRQNFTSKQTQENEIVRLVHNTIENSKTVACKNISKRREEYSRCFRGHTDDDSVETSLCVGLSFAVSRSRAAAGEINGDSYKRQKTEDVFPLPVWFKGCSNDNEKGNIDLELRLGDSPIVN